LNSSKNRNARCQRRDDAQQMCGTKTAKALGREVPLHLQQLADEVIE
jgi:hypothetical protein